MRLVYFADPMCSWCYGFGPALARALERRPATRLDLVMGGLRAFNTDVLTPSFRETLLGHWRHVADASGLPFNPGALDREGFVYDTEPACRAVVTARESDPAKAFGLLEALQRAFYRDGRDVTQAGVLTDIAIAGGFDGDAFRSRFESDALREATRRDFAATQALGIGGFPTLAAGDGPRLTLVTAGYIGTDVLEGRLEELERLERPPQ